MSETWGIILLTVMVISAFILTITLAVVMLRKR
jgi:hypothetical protein